MGATHLPVDEVKERIDRDLTVVSGRTTEAVEKIGGEDTMSELGVFVGVLFGSASSKDHFAVPLHDRERANNCLGATCRRSGNVPWDNPAAVTEVEPEDQPIAQAAIEHPFDFSKGHSALR